MNVMLLYTVDQIHQTVRAPYHHCHCTIMYARRETHGSFSTRRAQWLIPQFNTLISEEEIQMEQLPKFWRYGQSKDWSGLKKFN